MLFLASLSLSNMVGGSLRGASTKQPQFYMFQAPTSWAYEDNARLRTAGPGHWHLLPDAMACEASASFGSSQSPINIVPHSVVPAKWLPTLRLGGGYSRTTASKMKAFGNGDRPAWVNNGHTLELGPNHLAPRRLSTDNADQKDGFLASNQEGNDEVTAQSVAIDQNKLLSGATTTENHFQLQQQFVNPDVGYIDIGDLSKLNFQGPTLASNNTDEGWLEEGSIYDLLQIHLHWGRGNHEGSEHQIGGKTHPLEVHMVHTQRGNPYPTRSPGGLLVVSIMFEVDDETPNPELQHLVDTIKEGKLSKPGQTAACAPTFDIRSLLPEGFEENYLTYRGSLTTPGCFQSVNWVVSSIPLTVSSTQLEALRSVDSLTPGVKLTHNFRPIQPTNGRVVWMKGDNAYDALTAVDDNGRRSSV